MSEEDRDENVPGRAGERPEFETEEEDRDGAATGAG